MTDYYPSIRTIVAIFYFIYWYFKEIRPFNIWWLILIFIFDYLVTIFVMGIMKKILEKR